MEFMRTNNGISDDVFVDFPSRRELAIEYAEGHQRQSNPIRWSKEVHERLERRLNPDEWDAYEFVKFLSDPYYGQTIFFILDRPYDCLSHIQGIRDDINQIALTRTCIKKPYPKSIVPDVICVEDMQALSLLACRSPYIELLLKPTEGQPIDEYWIYFFARAEEMTLTNEAVEETELLIELSEDMNST